MYATCKTKIKIKKELDLMEHISAYVELHGHEKKTAVKVNIKKKNNSKILTLLPQPGVGLTAAMRCSGKEERPTLE
jgi:hypothetical protein